MGRAKGVQQTGRVAVERRQRTAQRQAHKEAIVAGTVASDLPEPLVPALFEDIQTTYWNCLKSVPDPRSASHVIYPLYKILHRIIAGFLGGARTIGVLFPARHRKGTCRPERSPRGLGAQPTPPVVYTLLRRIDWPVAQAAMAPLWERLGYIPDLMIHRPIRDPKEILDGFRRAEAEKAARKAAETKAGWQAAEKAQGMSAAKALRLGRGQRKRTRPPEQPAAAVAPVPGLCSPAMAPTLQTARQDLLLDGKVVRASYNSGCQERFVHVTAVKVDRDGVRQRFIVGAQPTVSDRNGEWGAALSILETLTPRSAPAPILVSGDAGFCVQEHAAWLTAQSFYYLFRIKGNAGGIFQRLIDWAEAARAERPEGDLFEPCRQSGADLHSRRLWRLPGLRFASFPGITEAFVVGKKALAPDAEPELQYYLTSYPRTAWSCPDILQRILLHWDTETGVFGIKDRTFDEDAVRYKHLKGATAHVMLLNMTLNCLWAPAFASLWLPHTPLSRRIQFFQDHPDYCPLLSTFDRTNNLRQKDHHPNNYPIRPP